VATPITFTVLQTEVYDETGLDSTDTNNAIRVKRWLNMTQNDIVARWPWNFMRGRETVVTVTDETAGTVSVNSGSTSVTGVGTNFSTVNDPNKFIQFAGANDWYNVSAVGSTTALTLATAYQPSTNASGVTYTLRKFFYSLSSSCDRIADVKNWNTPLKLDELFPRDVDLIQPNPQASNVSYGFIPYGYDSSGNIQIIPYPFPSDARLLEIKTFTRPVDMVNSGDVPSLPNKWAHIIAFGATALGFMYLRKADIAEAWFQLFEKKIVDMRAQERTSEDSSPILASIDSATRGENWLQMPRGTYPLISGRP
jgi:hypothetical protein